MCLNYSCIYQSQSTQKMHFLKVHIFLSLDTTIQKFGVGKIGISRDQFSLLTSYLLACLLLSYWLHNSTSLYKYLKLTQYLLNNYLTNYKKNAI